jgi:glycosyltransferase involved in cell wall biosynthesis
VAAFNIGGLPDMIDNKKNGILISPFNTSEMADEIFSFLNNNEEKKEFSVAARKKVLDNFDIKDVAKKYEAVYQSLL